MTNNKSESVDWNETFHCPCAACHKVRLDDALSAKDREIEELSGDYLVCSRHNEELKKELADLKSLCDEMAGALNYLSGERNSLGQTMIDCVTETAKTKVASALTKYEKMKGE